jgi:hypothetical protein
MESLTPQEHRILARGKLSLHPLSNVAYGTPGYDVMNLAVRGMLKPEGAERLHRLREMGLAGSSQYMLALFSEMGVGSTDYVVTRRGRDAFVSYGPPYVPISD